MSSNCCVLPPGHPGDHMPGTSDSFLRATPPAQPLPTVEALAAAILSDLDWRHGQTIVIGAGNVAGFAARILSRLSEARDE